VIIKIKASRPALAAHITIEPLCLNVPSRPLRILDFDCEARPLSWISADYVSKEITAIAWKWVGERTPFECEALSLHGDHVTMLTRFREAYNQADIVTGHYIRGYDLPMINGALMEYRMPPLSDKLAHDTKTDLVPRAGLSMSQENLGAMLRLEHPKVKMNQAMWRAANRLTPEGVELTRQRVIGDVIQHIDLRRELLESGWMNPPKVWRSTSEIPAYVP
jgi:hypothetical protein